MHEVLVNRLGGLSLPRKSVVRLTDRPDMTLDVYRGRKTTMQQQQNPKYLGTWEICYKFLSLVRIMSNAVWRPKQDVQVIHPGAAYIYSKTSMARTALGP